MRARIEFLAYLNTKNMEENEYEKNRKYEL